MYGKSLYGSGLFGDEQIKEDIEREVPDLMRYLPTYYRRDGGVMYEVQQLALAPEVGMLIAAIDELLKQFFVDTATWGLEFWERELGLVSDTTKSYERRREMIKAKLRGAGTTTKEMIQNVAAAFSGGDVVVEEEPEKAHFTIRFVGTVGIPPNMAGLTKTLEEIKPAHLSYSYVFTWSWWANLTEKGLTWNSAVAYTWDALRIYGLEE